MRDWRPDGRRADGHHLLVVDEQPSIRGLVKCALETKASTLPTLVRQPRRGASSRSPTSGSPPAVFRDFMDADCLFVEKPFSTAHLVTKVRQALAAELPTIP